MRERRYNNGCVLAKQNEMFDLCNDFGTITVSNNYMHSNALGSAKLDGTFRIDGDITDKNFPMPECKLKAGNVLRVEGYIPQNREQKITTNECIAFLKRKNAVLVGAQGARILLTQKCEKFLTDCHHLSFQEKGKFFVDRFRVSTIPSVYVEKTRIPSLTLANAERFWEGNYLLLCFRFV